MVRSTGAAWLTDASLAENKRAAPPLPARQWVARPGRQRASLRAQPEDAPQCALQSAGEQHLQLQLLNQPYKL